MLALYVMCFFRLCTFYHLCTFSRQINKGLLFDVRSQLLEGNGSETQQSCSFYVFVRYFGLDRAQTQQGAEATTRTTPRTPGEDDAKLKKGFIFYQRNSGLSGSAQYANGSVNMLKDVRDNCFCASLLRTQIHMARHASSARTKCQNEQ